MARVGYFWEPQLCERETGFFCPEKPARGEVLEPTRVFRAAGVAGRALGFAARPEAVLHPVHDLDYIETVRDAEARGRRFLDAGETAVTPNLLADGLLAASAGCEAVDQVVGGRLDSAFCAIRPPGHHANRLRAMGFCIFNNAAVAAAYAQRRYRIARVLIVDWDVHPGNGTMEIFWEDPTVFNFSIHQADLFPESGRAELTGEGPGAGFVRNVPIDPGTQAAAYLGRFRENLEPVVREFRPGLTIISAGFDAHRADPASRLGVEAATYGEMTRLVLAETAPFTGGSTVSLLEGGYNLTALVDCVAAHYRALADFSPGE